jgi:hypothetical protein
MYGLINKAVEDFVCHRFGEHKWNEIKATAGLEVETFVSLDAYPDDLTYRLVQAASQCLDLPPAAVLEALGEYWITFTGREGYGGLLLASGKTLPDFLQNLDNMHAHIGMAFAHSQMPSFRCTEISPGSLRLEYYSKRPGLGPMVKGLISGLGMLLNTEVSVEFLGGRDRGADHDEFIIRYADN